jgi:hypothetical protein
MVTNLSFDIFVRDPNFVPKKQQLRGVATIFKDVGIVNDDGYKALDDDINLYYPDSPDAVVIRGEEGDAFSYDLASPRAFPFFDVSNDIGQLGTQMMIIYREPHCMDPYVGTEETRFIMASVDHDRSWDDAWRFDMERGMRSNPVIRQLQAKLEALLGTLVKIGSSFW